MVSREPNHLFGPRQWFLVVSLFSALVFAQGTVIDRSVALVDGQVLTLSELEFESRVLLVQAAGVEAAFAPLEAGTLRKALDTVIGQRLETAEADKLKAYPLEEGELDRAVTNFTEAIGGPKELERFLKKHEADDSMLAVVLGRSLRTNRVLDGKLRLRSQVSEAEARRLQGERVDLQKLSLPAVRQKLFAERFVALTAVELAAVRKTGSVRLLGPYAGTFDLDGGTR